jgi:hypothetical protein
LHDHRKVKNEMPETAILVRGHRGGRPFRHIPESASG